MSTKTSIKRIALVAVSALGFGVLSGVGANAANDATFVTTSINITKYTTSPVTSSAVQVNFGAVIPAQAGIDDEESTGFTAALTSYPASGYVNVTAAATTAAGDAVAACDNLTAAAASASGATVTREADGNDLDACTVTSSTTVGLGSFSFTPTVAGDYVLTVWNDADADGNIDLTEARQTISISVAAAAAAASLSQAYSAAYSTDGNVETAGTADTDAIGITAPKAISAANAGAITVLAKNTSNAAITTVTVTASVSGVGLIKIGGAGLTDNTPTDDQCATGGVRAIAATAADAINTLIVCADGNAGTGTVSITITDTVSGATATFSKTVTFYGAVASYTATATKVVTGATAPANGATTADVILVVAKDAAGVVVPAQDAYFVSSDTTKVASAAITTATADEAADGLGITDITVANSATADRYGNITLTIQPSSTVTTPSTTVVITLSKQGADAYTLATDKSEYTVGEKITFTLTRTDAGRVPASLAAATDFATWTSNVSYNGTMATQVAANSTTGVTTWSVYAPTTPGTFTVTGTLAASAAWATALQATTVTKSLTISQDAATTAAINAATAAAKAAQDAAVAASKAAQDAAVAEAKSATEAAASAADAAAEAIDAANAATDAANLAAEAADAATVAAEEARDAADAATAAVEELATQVATLMAALKAQITTLANTVAKIAKKVKA